MICLPVCHLKMQSSAESDRTVIAVRLIVHTNQQLKTIIVGLCTHADRCLWLSPRFSLSVVFLRWHVKIKIVQLPCCTEDQLSSCSLKHPQMPCVSHLHTKLDHHLMSGTGGGMCPWELMRMHHSFDIFSRLFTFDSSRWCSHSRSSNKTHFISSDSRSQRVTRMSGILNITLLRYWDSCANSPWVRHSFPAFLHLVFCRLIIALRYFSFTLNNRAAYLW